MEKIETWLHGSYDEKTKAEIRLLLEQDPGTLADAFFKDLSFGTGGMRGIMGVGTNRVNIYTIRRATQGLCNYLKKQPFPKISVFIGYDVRHHSKEFAEEAARVFAGGGVEVFLTRDICPTPLVSFGCRHFHCQAAVMITASHNPKQYNGYKVYWQDGAQVVPPHDTGIMEEVFLVSEQIHPVPDHKNFPENFCGRVLAPLDSPLIRYIGDELDASYLPHLQQLYPELDKSSLKILYSPLHGTGIRLVPKALKSLGYTRVSLVEKQSKPDGDFPFASKPNPEESSALELGKQQLLQEKDDLFIATDPDADRIGVVVAGGIAFSGNQTACLLLDHICLALTEKKQFPPNAAFVKTIVTTELFAKIAKHYGGACIDVLTGFKYIAEKIAEWEACFDGYQYIFGAEESYGCLFGTFVRDKDAISTACLVAEAAALAKREGLTLQERLYALYRKHGVHREALASLAFGESMEGMQEMQSLMQRLRDNPPKTLAGQKVMQVEDYLLGHKGLPPSDVLRLWLQDQSKLVIRPSGTEPKVKIYAEVVREVREDVEREIAQSDKYLQVLMQDFTFFSGT